MSRLNEYFKKKTKNISFIEIQANSYININNYKVGDEVPLPIVIDELLGEIKSGDAVDEIKFEQFIKGIIYTIGVDTEFKYVDQYKDILYGYDEKIEAYILYTGLKYINENNLETGMVWLRALTTLNDENLFAKYNYALALEERAKLALSLKDVDLAGIFLKESTYALEQILKDNLNFHLAHYKLGYHYKNNNEFKKSQLTWEKFLRLGKEDELIQEIREQLEDMKDDVSYEEGCNDILSGDTEDGLDKLLTLKDKYNEWWNLHFMIGLAFRQLGLFEEAKESFEKVLKIEENQVDALNELGLCLIHLGNIEEGIVRFSKAIELRPNDYEIICNRGMSYLQLNDIGNAKKDILNAYNMNSDDEITISCKNEIEKYI